MELFAVMTFVNIQRYIQTHLHGIFGRRKRLNYSRRKERPAFFSGEKNMTNKEQNTAKLSSECNQTITWPTSIKTIFYLIQPFYYGVHHGRCKFENFSR